MHGCSQFCILSLVHLFDGLVTTASPPDILVSAVPGVILVHSASAEYPVGWHADGTGGWFVARVSELDPGDCDMLGTTKSSLASSQDFRDA